MRKSQEAVAVEHLEHLSRDFHCEISACYIKTYKTVIASIYRAPTGDINHFLNIIEDALSHVMTYFDPNIEIILAGDFNVNFADIECSRAMDVVGLLASYGLQRTVNFPTRKTDKTETCIDNIFTTTEIYQVTASKISISDHKPIILTVMGSGKTEREPIVRRVQTPARIKRFHQQLQSENWQEIMDVQGLNHKFNSFFSVFMHHFHECFPKRTAIPPARHRINDPLLHEMKETMNMLHDAFSMNRDPASWNVYRDYKTIYLKKCEEIRKAKINEQIQTAENKPKTVWNLIKQEVAPQKKQQAKLPECNEFSVYFQTAVEELQVKGSHRKMDCTPACEEVSMYLFSTCPAEVHSHIMRLKPKTSTDVYDLSVRTIRAVSNIVSDPMADIINQCFGEGIFPDRLKVGKVVPVFKKGDRGAPSNYRPITILPVFGKIIESVLTERITKFIASRNIVSPHQHGFQKGKGTANALLELMKFVREALDDGSHGVAAFYDLSRAFDCVPHDILLRKLNSFGIRGVANDLIRSYLRDRQQMVECDGCRSGLYRVTRGVAQGSLIGPVMFILYINDLPFSIPTGNLIQYADDTTYFINCKNKQKGLEEVERTTGHLKEWFGAHKLSLNVEKTTTVHFFTTRKESLETGAEKFLGVTVDSRLTWLPHIEKLSVASQCVNQAAGLMTYHALFHARMIYGIQIWGMSSHVRRIFILQKRAVRAIEGASSTSTCRPIFQRHHILTLPSEVILRSVIALLEQKPALRADIHDYNTRTKDHLVTPVCRLKTTENMYVAAKLFNKLPSEIRNQPIPQMKQSLKRFLIAKAYYTIEELLNDDI